MASWLKIVRTCPRCHKRFHQFFTEKNGIWTAKCVSCGHTWKARPKKMEIE